MWWLTPVIARLAFAYIGVAIVQKSIIDKYQNNKISKHKIFVLQFFFCAIIGTIVFGIWGRSQSLDPTMLLIAGFGFINAFAAFCQWQAVGISQSRNSIYTVLDDIIAMSFGAIFLKESRIFNAYMGVGISVSFLSLGLFIWRDYWRKKEEEKQKRRMEGKSEQAYIGLNFYLYVLTYSLIWGVLNFMMKFLTTKNIPTAHFVFSWYVGALIGAAVILFGHSYWGKLTTGARDTTPNPSKKDVLAVAALSLMIWASLALEYVAFYFAPIIVIMPIYLVAEMVLPASVGLSLFGERKGYTAADWFCFTLAITGGVIIATAWQ